MITTALAFVTGNWARLAIYGLVIIMALGTAAGVGYHKGVQRLWDYQVEQARAAVAIVVKQGKVTERVVNRYIKVKGDAVVVERTVEKEVTRYVETNPGYCLDADWRRLHDASTGAVPDPARSTDGTASGVEVAALTQTCTENYAEYHRTAARLTFLQAWAREQQKVNE